MKGQRVPAASSFQFLDYSFQAPASDPDLSVDSTAFWSYCGPLLTRSDDLPVNFHEWNSASLSGSLLPRFMPFLEFVNKILGEYELDHYWLTIRATKATSEFDVPRWHTDDLFFTTLGGGLRTMPREGDIDQELDLQTDWKLCTTLLGPSTMFIPPKHQARARQIQQYTRKALATDHHCASIRCIACAATSAAVQERLATELKPLGRIQASPNECAFFRIGQEKGAVHSEPSMSGGDRIFVNVVPGRRDELKKLTAKWGMSFPRSWWIAPNIPRGRDAVLRKY